jgi:subtilisin-like proprotein convertase family protein
MCRRLAIRRSLAIASSTLLCPLLNAYSAPLTFSNANSITLNEDGYPPSPAAPYPSTISVAGFPGAGVTKATVTLHGLSHTFPSDISMLLVGPHGQSAILMAQTGGQSRYSVTNLTLTLDDDVVNSLPIYTGLTSGAFRPTDGYPVLGYAHFPYDFPAPAPPGNSNSVSSLGIFKNTDPNGQWSLFVVDDSTGDTGSISEGWSLSLAISPVLQVGRSERDVVIAWPRWATNCLLQSSAGLSADSWSNVTNQPSANYGWLMVTNPASGPWTFFRLISR